MAQHPNHVPGYHGNLEDLARAVGNMRYEQTAKFIEYLAKDLERQSCADYARGRIELSKELLVTALRLYHAESAMQDAWKICKPYMK